MQASTSLKLQRFLETQQLAAQLMHEHGLTEQGWRFEFSNKKRAVGTWCCHSKRIEVSKHYIDTHPDEIEDTILHEIAHALSFIRYGEDGKGHGHYWRMTCIEIGANPTRTTDSATFSGNYNYTVSCQNEDCPRPWTAGRHRIKEAFWGYHCKFCKGPITVIDLRTNEVFYTTPESDW